MTNVDAVEPLEILLIEDDAEDADFLKQYLEDFETPYELVVVKCLGEGLERLKSDPVDVVLLDLNLPDARGAEGIQSIKEIRDDLVVVIISGQSDEELIKRCLGAGAEDYLFKHELNPVLLRRSIGYALSRYRQQQVSELKEILDRYHQFSSQGGTTSVTARMAGSGPLSEKYPVLFDGIRSDYQQIVNNYLKHLIVNGPKPREAMESVVTQLGDHGAGPRDLIDVHAAVMRDAMARFQGRDAKALASDARLLALEMMGMLVEYYRVGTRRP